MNGTLTTRGVARCPPVRVSRDDRGCGTFVWSDAPRISQLACSVGLALILSAPGSSAYEDVRVEDVTSDSLRAGLEAANERKWEAAERFFKIYLQETPEELSASGWSNLGNVELQLGKVGLAVEAYDKAVELSDSAAVPLLNRGLAYEELGVRAEKAGKHGEAMSLYQTGRDSLLLATMKDPDEFAAWYDLGLIDWRLEEFDEAADALTKAADLAAIPGYRVRAAASLYQIGDVQRARVQLRGVTRKNPNYGEAHAALAACYYSEGSVELAEDELRRATELDPAWGMGLEELDKNARWPPRLREAYARMISLGSGTGGE